MPIGTMVGNDVDDDPDAEIGSFFDQLLGLSQGPEHRIDVAVVGDVVAAVRHRGGVPGREPDGIDAEVAQVGKLRPHAGQIPDAVPVAVREAADVHLVDRSATPPRAWHACRPLRPSAPGFLRRRHSELQTLHRIPQKSPQ